MSRTLLDVLDDAARLAPDEQIVQLRTDGREDVQTYAALDTESRAVGVGLAALELERGAPVLVLCDRGDDFVRAFWGALRAGLVPVPLAPDPEKLLSVFAALERPPIVVCDDLAPLLEAGAAQMGMNARVLRTASLAAGTGDASALDAIARPHPDDVAYLQFSSGSTASPKGVEITHANVLANLAQMRVSCGIREGDVVVSWMPYFHDMGLVGTHLMPLACRFRQVKMGPLDFVRDPAAWLAAAHRHRATLLSAASFALGLITRRVPDEALDALDLSTVRMLGVGAEPISARAVRAFSEKLARARL
ncbi:MAG: AMP-binding protein, partial [Myxococcota bacterium]|nr:AMP-binding protein [Myxococcota bacterium]